MSIKLIPPESSLCDNDYSDVIIITIIFIVIIIIIIAIG